MSDTFRTPEWVKHAVFYQIFPERFANGDRATDPENVRPWGTPPTYDNFMGGDLHGIIDRLDYLTDLGVTALYLNPIFHASSNHKYNTYDYYCIDPQFGDLATFHKLLAAAHRRNIRVILDGVFNHCGRGFFAFHDLLENGPASPYRNWFHIEDFPLNAYDESLPSNYWSWWNLRSLPKFNTNHPPVRRFLLDVARYWLEQGADGWRLDVPGEIQDHTFWREFRIVVKHTNPDAYIVGEIWDGAEAWLDGTQFDAVMNYIFRELCRDFFAYQNISVSQFASGIAHLLGRYPDEAQQAQFNLLGSHDTARFLTEAGGRTERLYPAILFQMTFPGAPSIYYGDEIGLEGGDDPHCRGCFPWSDAAWNTDLYSWVRDCVALRHNYPALRTGQFRSLLVQDQPPLYAFVRWDVDQQVIVLLNPSDTAATFDFPLDGLPRPLTRYIIRDMLGNRLYRRLDGFLRDLHVPAWRGVVLAESK